MVNGRRQEDRAGGRWDYNGVDSAPRNIEISPAKESLTFHFRSSHFHIRSSAMQVQ